MVGLMIKAKLMVQVGTVLMKGQDALSANGCWSLLMQGSLDLLHCFVWWLEYHSISQVD